MLGKNTQLERSFSSFDVSTFCKSNCNAINLDELQGLQTYQSVDVTVKVVREGEATKVKNGLTYQDIVVGDATGCAKVTVWEKNVGELKEGCSY